MIVPWTAQRSSPSILKITPGISLEGMTLKLKLQYFGHLMQRVDSLENVRSDARGHDGPPLLSLPPERMSLTEDPPRSQGPMTAHFAGCHDEPPPPQSLMEGASQMPGTNDSTLRQLKPPRSSRIEKPISSRCHEPAAYPNLHPLAQPSLAMCIYKQTSKAVQVGGFPGPAPFRSRNPARSASPKPVKHFLGVPGHLLPNRKDFDAGRDWGQAEKGTTEDEMAGWHP